jgi:hypothetical protein
MQSTEKIICTLSDTATNVAPARAESAGICVVDQAWAPL